MHSVPFIQCVDDVFNIITGKINTYVKRIYIQRKVNADLRKKRLLAVPFFDFTKECPKEIVNCLEKREEYVQQITYRQKNGGCRSCDLPYIQDMIVKSFILKGK